MSTEGDADHASGDEDVVRTSERSSAAPTGERLGPADQFPAVDRIPPSVGPSPQWTAEEWEIYRLQRENGELRHQLDRLTGPDAAHRHALRWAAIMATAGVLLVLAIVLPSPVGVVCWALFAADVLGLAAYGITMDARTKT